MAASSVQRINGHSKTLAFSLLLIASLLNAGVIAEEEEVVTGTLPTVKADAYEQTEQTTAATATEDKGDDNNSGPAAPIEATDDNSAFTVVGYTDILKLFQPETPASIPAFIPARGDGPNNVPQPVPKEDVICVTKEAVQDKNAVSLKLKASSNCEETKVKFESVLQELCGEDCKLEIFQEDNSDKILVSGKYVEADVAGMADKFNNDNIKDKTDVEEAVPRWGKNSKLVLVSLLLTGLLLAALLVAGYYLKTHRKKSKGVRLAESFQVDEENQANTLVSVAPLPQEPIDKPTCQRLNPQQKMGPIPAPTTNGHSASQTPVADTEM
ncbi:Hematopoietic progenitor cell antigen CD34 [Larimichthys crocea]|uniref:Uncharacterized protein n=1 Tax=Larimichthys crocea TaxID=215358 RepID=A0ACD3RL05_LARCR|nr:Hematopoietic progenitor cell antigen CD34 [Larimichthys crocea]